jgi:hypothetical protein
MKKRSDADINNPQRVAAFPKSSRPGLAFPVSASTRQSQHEQQSTIEFLAFSGIEGAYYCADTVAAQRRRLVSHHLRTHAQAGGRGWFQNWTQPCRLADIGRQRADQNGRRLIPQLVRLDEDGRAGFSKVSRQGNNNNVPALHDQSRVSMAASIQSSMAALSGCRESCAASRRMEARTFGSRKSCTQCWTGRKPCLRKRSRQSCIRSRVLFARSVFGFMASTRKTYP